MAIYGTLMENNLYNIDLNLLENQLLEYQKLFESISIVTESSIVLAEGFDVHKIIDKVKEYWGKFKTWFKEKMKEIKSKIMKSTSKVSKVLHKNQYSITLKSLDEKSLNNFYDEYQTLFDSIEKLCDDASDILSYKTADELVSKRLMSSPIYRGIMGGFDPPEIEIKTREFTNKDSDINSLNSLVQADYHLFDISKEKLNKLIDIIDNNVIKKCDYLLKELENKINNLKDETSKTPYGRIDTQKMCIDPIKNIFLKVIPSLNKASISLFADIQSINNAMQFNKVAIDKLNNKGED